MRPKGWEIRIRDILHAAQKIVLHTQEMTFDQLARDEMNGQWMLFFET
jgi:uncharacterized protein with HEPN domain